MLEIHCPEKQEMMKSGEARKANKYNKDSKVRNKTVEPGMRNELAGVYPPLALESVLPRGMRRG